MNVLTRLLPLIGLALVIGLAFLMLLGMTVSIWQDITTCADWEAEAGMCSP